MARAARPSPPTDQAQRNQEEDGVAQKTEDLVPAAFYSKTPFPELLLALTRVAARRRAMAAARARVRILALANSR